MPIQGRRKWLPSPNVVAETGAVWGRYGRERLILFADLKSLPPNDFGVFNVPRFKADATGEAMEEAIREMVTKIDIRIHEHINGLMKVDITTGYTMSSDLRSRWLSLMDVSPNKQDELFARLGDVKDYASDHWGVRYERLGVVWGPADEYLLFTAPTVKNATEFVKHLCENFQNII